MFSRYASYVLFLLVLVSGCSRKHFKVEDTQTINDFSKLNKTVIHDFVAPQSYQELVQILAHAQHTHRKVTVCGIRHSQGGHAFYPHGIVISLKNLNKILDFDAEKNILTVQTGATWKEVQEYLNGYNRSVKIMQIANIFTVGGALSVNANGIDPHYGPLIESVKSLKIMLADGSMVIASRTENAELFKLAIGGYGLFGIILEVQLEVVENTLYKRESCQVKQEDYSEFIKKVASDPTIGFHIGLLNFAVYGDKLFSDITAIQYTKVDENKLSKQTRNLAKKVRQDNIAFITHVRQLGINILRHIPFLKALQRAPDEIKTGDIRSRNYIMSPPVSQLYFESKDQTELLQEYFIPVDHFAEFIKNLERATLTHDVNLIHVELRSIRKNTENFLSYVKQDAIGIVLYFSQNINDDDCQKVKLWTQDLIDAAARVQGTYYLPIQLHATQAQLLGIYPEIPAFFAYKKQYDSSELFMNHFYAKYAPSINF